MSTSGEIFKSIAKGFSQELGNAGKIVIKGATPKPTIAKADITSRREKVSFFGAMGKVAMGSKVPEAGIRADRSGWKKPEAPKPVQQVDTSAFGKKPYYTRKQADWWWAQELYKPENRGLLNKLMRYDPRKPGETRLQWAGRINNRLLGGVKDQAYPQKAGPIGLIIGDQDDKNYKLPMRKKLLEKMWREEKKSYKVKERKKIDKELLDKYWLKKK